MDKIHIIGFGNGNISAWCARGLIMQTEIKRKGNEYLISIVKGGPFPLLDWVWYFPKSQDTHGRQIIYGSYISVSFSNKYGWSNIAHEIFKIIHHMYRD